MAGLAKKGNPWKAEAFGFASITIGAEGGNVINVAVRLQDNRRKNITSRVFVNAYLADANTGLPLSVTAPNGTVAIGTNGTIIEEMVTKKKWHILTDASGRFDLNIGDSGTPTFYLVIVMPDGSVQVSNAITFA